MLPSFVTKSLQDNALLTKLSSKAKVSLELLQSEYQLAVQIEALKDKEKTPEELIQIKTLTEELVSIQKRIEAERALWVQKNRK